MRTTSPGRCALILGHSNPTHWLVRIKCTQALIGPFDCHSLSPSIQWTCACGVFPPDATALLQSLRWPRLNVASEVLDFVALWPRTEDETRTCQRVRRGGGGGNRACSFCNAKDSVTHMETEPSFQSAVGFMVDRGFLCRRSMWRWLLIR